MPITRRIVPLAFILSLVMLGGCAWLEKPLDPAVGASINEAKHIQAELTTRIDTLENAISAIEYDPDITPAESAVLADMQTTLKTLQASVADVGGWIDHANQLIDESATNEDAILTGVETLAAAFGLPFVGLGVPLWRAIRKSGKLKTAIVNLEANKGDKGTVDWEKLRIDNADAGLNTLLKSIRKTGVKS